MVRISLVRTGTRCSSTMRMYARTRNSPDARARDLAAALRRRLYKRAIYAGRTRSMLRVPEPVPLERTREVEAEMTGLPGAGRRILVVFPRFRANSLEVR